MILELNPGIRMKGPIINGNDLRRLVSLIKKKNKLNSQRLHVYARAREIRTKYSPCKNGIAIYGINIDRKFFFDKLSADLHEELLESIGDISDLRSELTKKIRPILHKNEFKLECNNSNYIIKVNYIKYTKIIDIDL